MNVPPPPLVVDPPPSNGTMIVSNQQRTTTVGPQYTTTVQERRKPGRTYVAVLPGHTRPVFVRDRKKPTKLRVGCGFGLSAIAEAFAPTTVRRSYSAGPIRGEVRVTSTPTQPAILTTEQPAMTHQAQRLSAPPGAFHTYGGPPLTAEVVRHPGHADEIVLQHTCSSCGKYRSPNYHSRHPLAPGEVPRPGVCRKCVKEHTSSDDSDEQESRHRRSRRHERSRRKKDRERRRAKHSDSTKDSSSSKDEVRIITRSYSADGGPRSRRRSESRSSPMRPARISISYEPGERDIRRSPRDNVRIVETTEHFDSRGRRRSESRSRESSEDLIETTRYLHRSGRGSGAHVVKIRNHFEDRRRSRSRSRSRHSSQDLVETVRYPNRSRRGRSRSSSSSPPQQIIRRVRYVDEPRWSRSRSRSRSSSRHQTLRYERSGEHHIEEDHTIRYFNAVERRSPPLFRRIDYGDDGGQRQRLIRRRPSILRRSESLDAHHRTPQLMHRRRHLDDSSGTYPGHVHDDHHYAEPSYEYEPQVDPWPQPASHLVRIIRVSTDDRGSEEHLAPRVHFARPASPRRTSVIESTVVESSEPVQRRRRRRFRVLDEDYLHERIEDYSLPDHYGPQRRYRATQAPSALATPQNASNRNVYVAAREDERNITRMLETTHITQRPATSPFREREQYASRSSSRRPPLYRRATAGESEHILARYAEASEDRVHYPEPERRERLLPPPPSPVPWEGQRWQSK